jgi:hypothetical protein
MSGTQEVALGSLTSRWRVTANVSPDDLTAARSALAGAIATGKTAEDLDPVSAKLPSATAQPVTAAAAAKTLAFVQTPLSVTVKNPLGTPAWAQGMAPSKRLGPFIDDLNLPHIIPIFNFTTSAQFNFAGAAGFAVFPVEDAPLSARSLKLGAGSVWFSAPLLAPAAAAGSFTGFLISGGTLTASAAITLQDGGYIVPDGATLTLTATLAPPAAGSGAPGADLTSATIALPASVTIEFTKTSAKVTALSNASVTLYGSEVGIAWPTNTIELLPGEATLIVQGSPNTATFAFNTVKSSSFVPSGTAKLSGAGWALPIAATTIGALGDASGAGSLVLGLTEGAQAASQPTGTVTVGIWEILIDPAQLFILIFGQTAVSATSYTLWPNGTTGGPPSSVSFACPAGVTASFLATPGQEVLTVDGTATAFLDRPLAADGGRLPITGTAVLNQDVTAAATRVAILGTAPSPATLGDFSVALENALIGIQAPSQFYIFGPVTGTAYSRADAVLFMASRWLLPTLPDPYAANVDPAGLLRDDEAAATGQFGAGVWWDGVAAPTMAFEIGASTATQILAPPSNTSVTGAVINKTGLTLLDLSTRVDLFGVAIYGPTSPDDGPAATGPSFVGLAVALPVSELVTFALPQISWEPMQSVGPEAPLGPIFDALASDGPPTLVYTSGYYLEQTLVPVEPAPVLLQNIANVAAGDNFSASFGLPFGLTANIKQVNRPGNNGSLLQQQGGAFGLVQPSFPGSLSGAYQLSLKPPYPNAPKAQFSGTTTVSADGTAPGYGYDVLSSDVATIFEGEFGGTGGAVPINRVDLSGYGASLFTEWVDNSAQGPAIIKVQFETIRGRTAYEVVKAQTTLYPYCIPLVRTITIARQNGGAVTRSDSGWVAAAAGLFKFPSKDFPQTAVNRGAIAGVYNVRNVVEFETVTIPGFTFRRVTFDADVGLDHRVKVVANGAVSADTDASGNPVTLVPATGLTGYVQLTPDESASGTPPPHLLPGPADIAALFAVTGAITNPLSCVAEIGYTASQVGTQLRATAFEIDMATAGAGAPALGIALLSAPILPKEGAWSFGKRGANASTPVALPTNAPVPLVQALTDAGNWHFADIADVLQLGARATIYGLLQDTGTQRTLFEEPLVKDLTGAIPPGAVPGISLPPGFAPVLADIGSLLNATGVFPQLQAAVNLLTGAAEQLQTIPQGLFYEKTYNFKGNEAPTTLLDIGILQVNLIYGDTSKGKNKAGDWNNPTVIQFAIDPAHSLPQNNGRDWWFSIATVSFAVVVPEFGSDPLLTIIGGFEADNRSTPGLTGLTVVYGSALDTLKSIFSKLQALAAFLPGGGGAGLDVSLSNGQLTVQDTFTLPTLPLGLGNLSDISLDLGLTLNLSPLSAKFIVGIGDPDNPFNWVLSPLAGNGAIDIGVQNNAPYLMIQGGIGLGLSIDVGIAEGSASITLAVQITINGETITLMIILNGQASIDVLGGLASASLSLTAAVGVSIDPLPVPVTTANLPPQTGSTTVFLSEDITFIAAVSVGIHITVCWVVSINFDGSWQFSQSVHTPQLTVES